MGVSEEELAARLSSCEVSRCEMYSSEVKTCNFCEIRHEAFILLIICLQSIFSVVEIIELFSLPKINSCLCIK